MPAACPPVIQPAAGQVSVTPSRPDGYLTTRESALLIGVSPKTIQAWRRDGVLVPQGLDERGYPLHEAEAVRQAERAVRENAIARCGVDPRRLRGRSRGAESARAETGVAA